MFYTFPELCEVLKLDEPTALALQQSGHLPTPVFIGERAVRWVRDTVAKWAAEGCPKCCPLDPPQFQLLRELVAEETCIMQNGGKNAKFLRAVLEESKRENARMNVALKNVFPLDE